jgi:hypothetical protein
MLSARLIPVLLALSALAGGLGGSARASIGIEGEGGVAVAGRPSHILLRVDASGDALVTWTQNGSADSVLVPPTGQLSHGGSLRGPDVSRPGPLSLVPDAVSVRRTPDGRLWALQELQLGAQSQFELDLSRWQGAPTKLTLSSDGTRLRGTLGFHGVPVSGHTFTLEGKTPRIYVFLDCFGCPGKPGWSPLLGVAPHPDGSFAVYLRPSWKGSRYRATVAGPNIGSTFAPDAQTVIASA